jgi:DNA-binding transcriptional MerR regulator
VKLDLVKLEEFLGVPASVINAWEEKLEIFFEKDVNGNNIYNKKAVALIEKIYDLSLEGIRIEIIKKFLSPEINAFNESNLKSSINYEFNESNYSGNTNLIKKNQDVPTVFCDREYNATTEEFSNILQMFIDEIRSYVNQIVEAENKYCLMQESEKRLKEQHFEIISDYKTLKIKLEEKEKKIRELEDANKRVHKLDMQLKLLQIEQAKKKKWIFWT